MGLIHRYLGILGWFLPVMFYSTDANAWGLLTHVYFAHSLLWAMPLLDKRLRTVIQRFPELVMAGACLPDLAIVSKEFRNTHDWKKVHELLSGARNDEEMAMAIGYASHLYIDVLAHNHFVPAHEAMWFENTMMTHIGSEWAMDAHLSSLVELSPGVLLYRHCDALNRFISPKFGCSLDLGRKILRKLAFWDTVLRKSKIPHAIYYGMRLLDRRIFRHFTYYIAKTQTAIADIEMVMQGESPAWEAEMLMPLDQLRSWRTQCVKHLDVLHPAPIPYFKKQETV